MLNIIKRILHLPVWGLLLIVAVIIIAIMLIFSSLNPWNPMNYFSRPEIKVDTSRAAVVKEIQALHRLETASFTIEKIIEAGTEGNAFQEILYGDRLLLIAHGKVEAGVDLSSVSENQVKVSGQKLELTLPASQIFSTYLDNTKTKVYDRQQGVLSRGDKDLESEARNAAEQTIKQAACDGGILVEASENAKTRLIETFKLVGFEEVNVDVPVGVCQ